MESPIINSQKSYHSPSNDRIERDPANLAILQSIDFNASFDSSNIEHSSAMENDGPHINLDDISFDSFDSDEENFGEIAGHVTSTPIRKSNTLNNDAGNKGKRPIPLLNKRNATSPVKGITPVTSKRKLTGLEATQSENSADCDLKPSNEDSTESINLEKSRKVIEEFNFKKPDIQSFPFLNYQSSGTINGTLSNGNITIEKNQIFTEKYNVKDETANNSFQRRTFSTVAPRQNPKKNQDLYHSIQLSTQKPFALTNEIKTTHTRDLIKNVKPIILSKEQEYVLQLALKGASLFYTGSAGTGKSVLLKSIIKVLRSKHKHGQVAVTASTGLAACNIGGNTLHSFSGVGLGYGDVSFLLKKVRKNKKAVQRWNEVKVLIIDEISMIDGHFLNKLDEIGRKLRKKTQPFGGIQLIVCGDFYQLPPVVKKTAPDGSDIQNAEDVMFAFESMAWQQAITRTIILKEVFRQKGDQKFIDMLNEMRDGKVSDETVAEFKKLSRSLQCPEGIVPAELFATRKEVDKSNNTRLAKLSGDAQVYSAVDSGSLPNPSKQNLLSNFLAPQNLYLKKDAQVMCIKNFDETLVNGSLGQVVDFLDRDTYMKAYKNNSDTECTSMIKENNDTTGDESFDKDSDFAFDLKDDKESSQVEIANKERKKALSKDLVEESSGKKYPLVKFLLPDGVNTRMVLVEPEQWTVEDEHQNILLSRIQLPLILAWSLSIHKSQGQTLPKVKVDLRNVFENGQSYVALSRAVSRNGLQVLNFDKFKVRAHPKVVKFYKTLSSAEEISHKTKGQQKLEMSKNDIATSVLST